MDRLLDNLMQSRALHNFTLCEVRDFKIEIVALEELLGRCELQRLLVLDESLVLDITPLLVDVFLVVVVHTLGNKWCLNSLIC